MRRMGVVAVAVGLLAGAGGAQGGEDEKERLQGTWSMAKLVVNGEAVPAEQVEAGRLIIEGDGYTATLGDRTVRSTFKLEGTTEPRPIDFTYDEGPQKGETVRGIYKLEGPTLTICRGLTSGDARPDAFAAPADSGRILVVWKRAGAAGGKDKDKEKEKVKDAAIRAERERLRGTWTAVAYARDGREVPPEQLAGVVVVFDAEGTATVRSGDRVVVQGRTAIDPTASPKTIDLTFTEGPNRGQTAPGIYEVRGNTYRLCRAEPGKPRPATFAAGAGSGLALMTYRREGVSAEQEAAVQEELKKFAGTWRFASVEVGGRPMPLEGLKGPTLVLEGDRFTMNEPAGATHGSFAVDPSARPKTMDVTFTDGPEAGKVIRGIYELDGDTYRLCIGTAGKSRPAAFVSKPGSGDVLEVMKRDKP